VKGDRVEVLVDVGSGVQRFDIAATKAGRRVEVANVRGTIEVTEVTRSGTPVRTARFMAAKVVAVVEHPALDGDERVQGRRDRGRAPGGVQEVGPGTSG
jgi:nucleoid-associated protein YgaU